MKQSKYVFSYLYDDTSYKKFQKTYKKHLMKTKDTPKVDFKENPTLEEKLESITQCLDAYDYQIHSLLKNTAMKVETKVMIIKDNLSDLKKALDDAGHELDAEISKFKK